MVTPQFGSLEQRINTLEELIKQKQKHKIKAVKEDLTRMSVTQESNFKKFRELEEFVKEKQEKKVLWLYPNKTSSRNSLK